MESLLKKTTTNLSITIIFALTFVLANYNIPSNELILSTGYLLLLLGTTFYLGNQWVIQKSQIFLESKKERYLIFPIFILIIFYSFLFLHGGTPFKGSSSLHMFLFLFPTLYFLAFPTTESRWSDLMVVLLILIPSTVIKFNGNSNLPVEGSGFGSVQKFSLILGAAYSFIFVRKLKDVGFTLVLNTYNTIYSIISWLLFIGFVYIIGFIYDFNLAQPFAPLSLTLISISILELIRIYFGTALMEELFFRGLIQNILFQRMDFSKQWKNYWIIGFGLFFILSLVVGYALEPPIFWFPALICTFLFIAAYYFESKTIAPSGSYTALAITSIFFGLVHFHAGSILFVGLASVAGWAYGYTYLKTKNVFYAALVHTLVNASEFLFTLDQLKK